MNWHFGTELVVTCIGKKSGTDSALPKGVSRRFVFGVPGSTDSNARHVTVVWNSASVEQTGTDTVPTRNGRHKLTREANYKPKYNDESCDSANEAPKEADTEHKGITNAHYSVESHHNDDTRGSDKSKDSAIILPIGAKAVRYHGRYPSKLRKDCEPVGDATGDIEYLIRPEESAELSGVEVAEHCNKTQRRGVGGGACGHDTVYVSDTINEKSINTIDVGVEVTADIRLPRQSQPDCGQPETKDKPGAERYSFASYPRETSGSVQGTSFAESGSDSYQTLRKFPSDKTNGGQQ